MSKFWIFVKVLQVMVGATVQYEIAKESLLTGQPVEGWLTSNNIYLLLNISQRYHQNRSGIIA